MAIEARNRPIPDWFTRIRTRQTVLPRFQRFEAWGHAQVTQLFNTILQDLPVGAVLVLEVGNDEPFRWRALKGAPETGEKVTEQLLDGQQRLTALWRGLHNNYEERSYFLFLEPDEETGAPYYVGSIARWKKQGEKERRPFWVDRPAEQWQKRMVPLDLCTPDIAAQLASREWSAQAITSLNERETVLDQVSLVRQKLAGFNLPFLSLPVTTRRETALDVFIKMNTSAAPLSIYDIVVAQVEASMDKSLHDLVAEIRRECPSIAAYYPVEGLALYSSALLQGRPAANSTYMAKDFGTRLLDNWDLLLKGASRAATFLEQERVFDAARLPTEVVVPVLVALWSVAPDGKDAEGRARTILRRYLWRSFFCSRYEKSTSTRSIADFNDLKVLVTQGTGPMPAVLDDAQYPLPQPEELVDAGWPVRKDRLGRAILALALKSNALDLADGSEATRANLAKREYHHLFPVAHLTRAGIPDERIFLSLNCALVTWCTNRAISDKEPERYLAERREGTGVGEDEVRSRLATHLIPYDEMVAGKYSEFLEARASMVHARMTELCQSGAS